MENGISKVVKKRKSKGRLGRPPKIDKSDAGGTNVKAGTDGGEKKLKHDPNYSGTSVECGESGKIECAAGKQLGRREQQQLVRDQIVALLKKAGWTIEYRPRLTKDYNDPVYVGRDGRGYWSCTLAYRVLKKRIEDGVADDKEVSAFSPIPEELLSTLFRVRKDEGKKKGKGTGKTGNDIAKKVLFKIQTLGRRIKSRSSKGKRRTLLARRPGEGSDDYELYEGKRTLLSWMIDLGTVPPDGKVKYKRGRNKKVMLEGKITRDGICCSCCDKIHTIWDFESHAKSEPRDPYKHIYLESGNSLLQCLIDSWNKQLATDHIGYISVDVDGNDPNDDTCNICGDGGNLICCDGCPSTFHQGCLCINKVPSGDWYCAYCSCKFCGVSVGNVSPTDDSSNSIVPELLMCHLCEEKFHVPCIECKDTIDFDDNNPAFCGTNCQKIFEHLQALIGVRQELEGEYSYTILQRREISCDVSVSDDTLEVESNSKLAVAFSVMDECFLPIIDERSKTNVIHNVVYSCGSNFRRLNFEGFYTIILEKGDELVAAASIRIHGSQLAEMPFIGTRYMYRRQGLCSRLLTAIEMVLRDLNVAKMVIPAISELNETWTKIFSFVPLEESKRREMRFMSMVVFPGIDMLQKPLLKHQFAEGQGASTDESTEAPTEHQNMQEEPNDDIGGVAAPDVPISSEVEIQNLYEAPAVHISLEVEIQNLNEAAAVESHASVPDCSNDASDIISGTVKLSSLGHENEKSLDHVNTTNDDNPYTNSKTSAGDAHELETQIPVEEINSCPNGIIPDRKLVKCN
ncbi:Acyl-CoA N-acyltransferase with RING/FYVE/PHD-type zinc finger protein [Abeliophyllum distichum]|uniref:Acyl-CoA N-acyltransferase with RING/FYVE/PHD-type zinc finger protein n=1 Tax=Abeliophyllum distichum TaxID=126358 RepID=A0ABD1SCH1_9LAMI